MSQALEALSYGQEIRLARTAIKREVASGATDLADVLDAPPVCMGSAPIVQVLTWQHRWGADRASRLLRRVRIPEMRLVRDLSDRQRRLLVSALRGEL